MAGLQLHAAGQLRSLDGALLELAAVVAAGGVAALAALGAAVALV
jgi:hypothetical protein